MGGPIPTEGRATDVVSRRDVEHLVAGGLSRCSEDDGLGQVVDVYVRPQALLRDGSVPDERAEVPGDVSLIWKDAASTQVLPSVTPAGTHANSIHADGTDRGHTRQARQGKVGNATLAPRRPDRDHRDCSRGPPDRRVAQLSGGKWVSRRAGCAECGADAQAPQGEAGRVGRRTCSPKCLDSAYGLDGASGCSSSTGQYLGLHTWATRGRASDVKRAVKGERRASRLADGTGLVAPCACVSRRGRRRSPRHPGGHGSRRSPGPAPRRC